MKKITFKGTEYQVTQTCTVHPDLAAEGLKDQLIIEGKRGATYLLQIWSTRYGLIAKRISTTARLEVELLPPPEPAQQDLDLTGAAFDEGYSLDDLAAAFETVHDPDDWKNPIDAKVSGQMVDVTVAAIIFYTATVPTVSLDLDTMKYCVRSIGYRAGPAGDH